MPDMSQLSTRRRGLVRGRYIILGDRADGTPEITENGAIVFRDGLSRRLAISPRFPSSIRISACSATEDAVIRPGLVNSHHHVGLTPLQLGSPDYPLELWFASRLGARDGRSVS